MDSYGVLVGKGVNVGGTYVFVGITVAVKDSGVNVSGSVGTSVSVGNVGMIVTPGVMVGTSGTHNRSPGKISLLTLQLADFKASTVVPYCKAM